MLQAANQLSANMVVIIKQKEINHVFHIGSWFNALCTRR